MLANSCAIPVEIAKSHKETTTTSRDRKVAPTICLLLVFIVLFRGDVEQAVVQSLVDLDAGRRGFGDDLFAAVKCQRLPMQGEQPMTSEHFDRIEIL